MSVSELKPCPFCGNDAEINDYPTQTFRAVSCKDYTHCGAMLDCRATTEEEAADTWNTRVAYQWDKIKISNPIPYPLPDCMVPDGGDTCLGYKALLRERDVMLESLQTIAGERQPADNLLSDKEIAKAMLAKAGRQHLGGESDGA